MEIRLLRTFLTVSRLLSFNKAADALHYAQSSVSAQIAGLEAELNLKLFDRLGKHVILTEAGERLIPYAQKMVELEEETRAAFKPKRSLEGVLSIRVPESLAVYRLTEVVALFRGRFPGVALRFLTCARESLARDLQKGVTDLAFLLDDSLTSTDLQVCMLASEPLVLAVPPDHALAARGEVVCTHLADETWLLSRTDCSYRRLAESCLRQAGMEMKAPVELNSLAAIKSFVRRGLGITILPRIAVDEEVRSGALASVQWRDGPQETALLMIWHRRRWLSPLINAFMETARSVLESPQAIRNAAI